MAISNETKIVLEGRPVAPGRRRIPTAALRAARKTVEGVAAAGVAFGITASIFVNRSINFAVEIQKSAEMAGVSTTAFQELKLAAEQSPSVHGRADRRPQELQLRADEFVRTGVGPASESFLRLGLDVDQVRAQLTDTRRFVLVLIERMQGLSEAAQIRVSDEIFGGQGGEQFVALIRDGREAIAARIAEANAIGAIVSPENIGEAVVANRALLSVTRSLRAIALTIGLRLAPALAAVLRRLRGSLVGIFDAGDIRSFAAAVGPVFERASQILEFWLDIWRRLVVIWAANKLTAARVLEGLGFNAEQFVGSVRESLLEFQEARRAIRDATRTLPTADEIKGAAELLIEQIGEIRARWRENAEEARQRLGPVDIFAEPDKEKSLLEFLGILRFEHAKIEAEVQKQQRQIIQNQKAAAAANVVLWEQSLFGKVQVLGNIARVLASIAGTQNRTAFEIGKRIAAAETLLEAWRSAVDSFNAMIDIPWVGWILAIIAFAAALAAGLANVAKILSTKFGAGFADRPAIPRVPTRADVPRLRIDQEEIEPPDQIRFRISGCLSREQIADLMIPALDRAAGPTIEIRAVNPI